MFVVIGYMVLIRDIWTPLVLLTPLASTLGSNDGDYVLMGFVVLLMPFVFQRSLHALRYNCYVGFISVMILCFALWRGALLRKHDVKPQHSSDVQLGGRGLGCDAPHGCAAATSSSRCLH